MGRPDFFFRVHHLGVKQDIADEDEQTQVQLRLEGESPTGAHEPGSQAEHEHEGEGGGEGAAQEEVGAPPCQHGGSREAGKNGCCACTWNSHDSVSFQRLQLFLDALSDED